MTKEKRMLYQKAYVELYELIKLLSEEQQSRIPREFIQYIINNKDNNYYFTIDNSKGLFEQEYMVETKALIVKMYEKYLAPENEKEFWNKYDKICLNMIEEEKREKYDPDTIFQKSEMETKDNSNNENNSEKLELVEYKESFISKILNMFKKLLNKFKR